VALEALLFPLVDMHIKTLSLIQNPTFQSSLDIFISSSPLSASWAHLAGPLHASFNPSTLHSPTTNSTSDFSFCTHIISKCTP